MNIASAVVYAVPGRTGAVREQLRALPGVEIHAETADGRFVVTVEDAPEAAAADTIVALHRLEGVLSAAMVYQYCDEAARSGQAGP
ncbi:MAG TPA: chaperone NapD [Burkholderiales bacterium]|nr:chaperone NapD [Burkholderiales bacterium]